MPDAARVTRIKQAQLVAMEKDDFRSIPAPVYARGFIKQYAQFLGLDPVPLIAEFNARLGGARPAAPPSLRPAGTGPAPAPRPVTPPPPPPAEPETPPPAPEAPIPVAAAWDAPSAPSAVVPPFPADDLFHSLPSAVPLPVETVFPVAELPPAAAAGEGPPDPPPPAPPPPPIPEPAQPATPRFQPVVMETGAPELLHRSGRSPEPEKVPAWKDPVVVESGRLVQSAAHAAGQGDAFRPPEPVPSGRSGARKTPPAFPPGVLKKVGAALAACAVLAVLLRACGGGGPAYQSIRDVPLPDNPVLREPADPYMQSR